MDGKLRLAALERNDQAIEALTLGVEAAGAHRFLYVKRFASTKHLYIETAPLLLLNN